MAHDKGTPNGIPVRELSRNPLRALEAKWGNAQAQALGHFDAGLGRPTPHNPVPFRKRG